jgi:hypothetical protein
MVVAMDGSKQRGLETFGAAARRLIGVIDERAKQKGKTLAARAGNGRNQFTNAGKCVLKPVQWGGSGGIVNPRRGRCHANDNACLVAADEERG